MDFCLFKNDPARHFLMLGDGHGFKRMGERTMPQIMKQTGGHDRNLFFLAQCFPQIADFLDHPPGDLINP